MSKRSREDLAVMQMIEETRKGVLEWRALDLKSTYAPLPMPSPEARVQEAYLAKRGDRHLRLCKYLDKYFDNYDEWHWVERMALEATQNLSGGWWEFPSSRLIGDLLRAVQYQANGVGGLLDDLLRNAPPQPDDDDDDAPPDW